MLPISVNGSFHDLINCAYSDSFLLVIRKGICHIPEGLSDINSFPITWMLDILAAFPDGSQPFFFTFLSGIPFYDERHIVVLSFWSGHKPSTSSLRHWFYFPDMIASLSFHNVWIMALFHGFEDSDNPDQPTTALMPFPIFYTTVLPSFLYYRNDILLQI